MSKLRFEGAGRAVVALISGAAVACWPGAGVAGAADLPSSPVNTIHTSAWTPASPDPSGITYDAPRNRLVVTDGEVEEMAIYAGANFYESSLGGALLRVTNTVRFNKEPTGVDMGPEGRMFMTSDDDARIQEITLGPNGRFDERDRLRFFSVAQYGKIDAEGVAYDPIANRLFIADGSGSEIYRLRPVDGVFGNGNDSVAHFDTSVLGVADPESVAFDPATRSLFIVSTGGRSIVQTTPSGTLINQIDISYLGRMAPAGIALAPRSNDPTQRSAYIVDRGVDNSEDPAENDGRIHEIALPPMPGADTSVAFALTAAKLQRPLARNRGIRVKVFCPLESCTATVGGAVTLAPPRKGVTARRVTLPSRRIHVATRKSRTVTLRLSPAQRSRLLGRLRREAPRGGVAARMTATVTDAAGNTATKRLSIRIRR